jgi:cytochrome c oxidase subunit 2
MNTLRRALMLSALGGSVALLMGRTADAQDGLTKPTPNPNPHHGKGRARTIKIRASKFEFKPNHVTIRQGDQVVFELTSVDFTHGFSIPDLNVRADVPPGQATRLPVTALQPGEFIFLCDNFCGDGHEKMQGKLTVTA